MEAHSGKSLDSPSRNSYIGSYYQPPDIKIPLPRKLEFPFGSVVDSELPTTSHHLPKSNIDSKAVVEALKTLQQKINRVEAETTRHTENNRQMLQEAQRSQQFTISTTLPCTHMQQPRQEHDAILRCKTLQKHLEKTKQCIEQAKKEQSALQETRAQEKEQHNTSIQEQNAKLEKLELEYEKLSRTQALSRLKLVMLEEKLQKEEHERKLVQEKAEELQREFNNSLRMSTEESNVKKKSFIPKKGFRQTKQKTPSRSNNQKIPFVAGMSTSPSHSVHANVQCILHMMKHHQPQLHERISLLRVRKGLHKDFLTTTTGKKHCYHESSGSETSVESLSDLLLALQDELGEMSFEHQDLMYQIDDTLDFKKRQDLKKELERLVSKMEEKGAQITMLRKHQQTIHKKRSKNKHDASHFGNTVTMIYSPAPSPVKPKKKSPKKRQRNLQLLRETQQFRNSLQQSDLFWES